MVAVFGVVFNYLKILVFETKYERFQKVFKKQLIWCCCLDQINQDKWVVCNFDFFQKHFDKNIVWIQPKIKKLFEDGNNTLV